MLLKQFKAIILTYDGDQIEQFYAAINLHTIIQQIDKLQSFKSIKRFDICETGEAIEVMNYSPTQEELDER